MNHTLGCLLLAEITGRTPITLWGENSLFRGGGQDAFALYWAPVSTATIADATLAARSWRSSAIYISTAPTERGLSECALAAGRRATSAAGMSRWG